MFFDSVHDRPQTLTNNWIEINQQDPQIFRFVLALLPSWHTFLAHFGLPLFTILALLRCDSAPGLRDCQVLMAT
jgi:hypothetical protein